MARKSRKTVNQPVVQNVEPQQELPAIEEDSLILEIEEYNPVPQLTTAAYIRLSVENNGHESDESIQTQIALVEGYIRENPELRLVETYVDNGISGTRFDRPEFVRLMDDVRSGKITCIVVKDLSRFGRDYLETGYYLETIFPLLNVRFIAITDHFDSSREADRNGLAMPIKNLVNDMYAKDYSKKQEVFRNMCKSMGRVMGTNQLYGYKFSKEIERLVIDEEIAPYVRMVFAWALSGVARKEIARRMNLIGAISPADHDNWDTSIPWSADTVTNIIYNPVYAGFHVMGKRKDCLYKGIKKYIDRDEWLYFPDYHEPYITMDEYEKVTEIYKRNRRNMAERMAESKEDRERLPDFFPQKVWCANCNRKMTYLRGSHHRGYKHLSFGYYRCRSLKANGKCQNKHVQGNFLQMMVMDQIRELVKLTCDKNELLKKIESKAPVSGADMQNRKVGRLRAKEQKIEERLMRAYMDYADKLLDEGEYSDIRKKLVAEKESLQEEIVAAEEKAAELNRSVAGFKEFANHMADFLEVKELTQELADELIEKIVIYNDGERIEIVYKCQNIIENALLDAYLKGDEL